MIYTRYAIFYVPQDADWSRFATAWLGWDMIRGAEVAHPDITGLDVGDITQPPRKYGLHATLKPPFGLRKDSSRSDLEKACATLADRQAPVTAGGLSLTRMGRFLALRPVEHGKDLTNLAAAIVTDLDRFRAPDPESQLQSRRGAGLSPSQEANLANWGYPYVMDDFRFHITLTGRQPKTHLPELEAVLIRYLVPLLPAQMTLTDMALTGEDKNGRFHLLKRFPFSA